MSSTDQDLVRTNIPARMDRLPWAKWHWLIILGLGTVWILDGLEVTIVGNISGALTGPEMTSVPHALERLLWLGQKGGDMVLSGSQIGFAGGAYIAGACLGALFFGVLTDKFGRKKLFLITLTVYLAGTVLTAISMNPIWFFACRFLTGTGIGGEYAAIYSAIDELIPAKYRGTVDLAISGTFWAGAMFGSLLSVGLLGELTPSLAWRFAFGLGAIFGLVILLVRKNVPESPRWMFLHGLDKEADVLVSDIEKQIETQTGKKLEPADEYITVKNAKFITIRDIMRAMVITYPRRSILGLAMFVGQAFIYNAVFFTQVLVLIRYFNVDVATAPLFVLPLAVGNLLGPILLGPLFDSIGRKVMITFTFIASGVLLFATGLLFQAGVLNAMSLTGCWIVVFFFASAAASSAYLTVSEIFPMETRALAIAFYYAIGTAIGGISGPLLFGKLIDVGTKESMALGYFIGAALMIVAGIAEVFLGIETAGRSLEDIARPLSEQPDARAA